MGWFGHPIFPMGVAEPLPGAKKKRGGGGFGLGGGSWPPP
jgi:hypothetical protein